MNFLRTSLTARYGNGNKGDIFWGLVEKTIIVLLGAFLTVYVTVGKLEVRIGGLEKQLENLTDCLNTHLLNSIPKPKGASYEKDPIQLSLGSFSF